MKRIIIYLPFVLLLNSCIKQIDGPINVGLSQFPKIEIPMTDSTNDPSYLKQYYNIATKSIVKTSRSKDWDIAFCSNSSSNLEKVQMNYAYGQGCSGFTLQDTAFETTKTYDAYNLYPLQYANYYDNTSNLFSGNFLGNANKQYVYYLQMGDGRTYKIKILNYNTSSVKFIYSNLDNSKIHTVTLPLKTGQNYTYFSFNTGNEAVIEPSNKSTWDFEFTRYTTLVTDFNITEMYHVNGVLFNPSKSIVASKIDNQSIDNISLAQTTSLSYSNSWKYIGYDWKSFSSASSDGFYTILPRVYIVKVDGYTYSIQFIEYAKVVNDKRINGYPTFLQNKL